MSVAVRNPFGIFICSPRRQSQAAITRRGKIRVCKQGQPQQERLCGLVCVLVSEGSHTHIRTYLLRRRGGFNEMSRCVCTAPQTVRAER